MRKSLLFSLTLMSAFLFSQKKWTLQECVNYAIENNLQVIQNEYNKKLQDYSLSIAKRQYLPSVSGNVNNSATFGQAATLLAVPAAMIISATARMLVQIYYFLTTEDSKKISVKTNMKFRPAVLMWNR